MEKEIKPEELIPLVHERAVLWDKTLDDYKINNLKLLAWREICTILIPNFENMEEKERQHFSKCQQSLLTIILHSYVFTVVLLIFNSFILCVSRISLPRQRTNRGSKIVCKFRSYNICNRTTTRIMYSLLLILFLYLLF